MTVDSEHSLSVWTTEQLSEGILSFTIDEAMQALGVSRSVFLNAAERLQRKKWIVKPRPGFYVIVPPKFLGFGAPMPSMYIDDLMKFVDRPYYVGLRKAAEFHGATHQGVMQFQVMTSKQLPSVVVGSSGIVYYYRKNFESIKGGVQEFNYYERKFRISSPELTALDILRYPRSVGTIDSVATVLSELGEVLDVQKLAPLARTFNQPIIQRLGYLLEWLGFKDEATALKSVLNKNRFKWIELDPYLMRYPEFAPDPVDRNIDWRVRVRYLPDPDC